jgi:hypothetical protein
MRAVRSGCGARFVDAQNVTVLHGTGFGITTVEAGLRSARPLSTRKFNQDEVASALANWPAWIEQDSANEPAEVMDPDNDPGPDDDADSMNERSMLSTSENAYDQKPVTGPAERITGWFRWTK